MHDNKLQRLCAYPLMAATNPDSTSSAVVFRERGRAMVLSEGSAMVLSKESAMVLRERGRVLVVRSWWSASLYMMCRKVPWPERTEGERQAIKWGSERATRQNRHIHVVTGFSNLRALIFRGRAAAFAGCVCRVCP